MASIWAMMWGKVRGKEETVTVGLPEAPLAGPVSPQDPRDFYELDEAEQRRVLIQRTLDAKKRGPRVIVCDGRDTGSEFFGDE